MTRISLYDINKKLVLIAACISLLFCGNVRAGGSDEESFSGPAVSRCLPASIKLSDVVSTGIVALHNDGRAPVAEKVTVGQKLKDLKASCRGEILVDGGGREIYFYHLTGCWGNPPAGYQNIMQRQRDELNGLKERYTVIEMTCNPSGRPRQ